jgi:hypothetical protein
VLFVVCACARVCLLLPILSCYLFSHFPDLASQLGLANLSHVWLESVLTHGPAETSIPIPGTGFFNLVFLLIPGAWVPLSTDGSDAWALAWMRPWMQSWAAKDPRVNSTLYSAYRHLAASAGWTSTAGVDGVMGQFIHVNPLWDTEFPFDDAITTSLFPMVRYLEHL